MPGRGQLAFAVLLALIFAALTLAPACRAGDPAKLPAWKPDPKIVEGLGPEIVVGGSAFRIPQTVSLTESRTLDSARVLKWRGDRESDGIRPMFMLLELPLSALTDQEKKDPAVNANLGARYFSQIAANMMSEIVTSSLEQGQIAGQPFSRQYFKGYNQRWLHEVHGFTYSTVTSRAIYAFLVWDQEPISKYSLPVYEAAVLTFHATDQPDTPFPENLIDPDDAKLEKEQAGQ